MVGNDLVAEEVEHNIRSCTQSASQAVSLRREPSFSRWCNEDGGVLLNIHKEHYDASIEEPEEPDFELPFLQQQEREIGFLGHSRYQYSKFQMESVHMNGSSVVNSSIHGEGSKSEKYSSLNIEHGAVSEKNLSYVGANGLSSISGHEVPAPNSESSISAANVLKTLFFILVWYTFSTLLTLYNKTLLGDDMGKFPAPMLMNTVHFTMQAILSKGITWFWSHKYQTKVTMSWTDYFVRVVPTALATAMDVNLSNESLVFISVTFATMCKSAAPIFLLLFAFAFRLESPSIKLMGIISVISIGILLTVAKETAFQFWGFIFVMLAAVMSGFRWCMTQILLQKEAYGLKDPLTLMSYIAPVMALATAILSLLLDPWDEFNKNNYFNSSRHLTRSCLLMLLGGTLAFFMVLTEYILVSVTSAVTVTIAGVVKEAVTILVAVFYFHDEFTWLKGLGLLTIMVGVSLFNWYKYQKLQKGHHEDDHSVSPATNASAKYVILEEMDDQADET